MFTVGLMIAALILFYIAIFSDSIYYHNGCHFEKKDVVVSCVCLIAGITVMLLVRTTIYGFLIGALIAAGGNLWMLIMKYKGVSSKKMGSAGVRGG